MKSVAMKSVAIQTFVPPIVNRPFNWGIYMLTRGQGLLEKAKEITELRSFREKIDDIDFKIYLFLRIRCPFTGRFLPRNPGYLAPSREKLPTTVPECVKLLQHYGLLPTHCSVSGKRLKLKQDKTEGNR